MEGLPLPDWINTRAGKSSPWLDECATECWLKKGTSWGGFPADQCLLGLIQQHTPGNPLRDLKMPVILCCSYFLATHVLPSCQPSGFRLVHTQASLHVFWWEAAYLSDLGRVSLSVCFGERQLTYEFWGGAAYLWFPLWCVSLSWHRQSAKSYLRLAQWLNLARIYVARWLSVPLSLTLQALQCSLIPCFSRYAEAESRYGPRPEVQAAVAAYCKIAQHYGMTPTELALRYTN